MAKTRVTNYEVPLTKVIHGCVWLISLSLLAACAPTATPAFDVERETDAWVELWRTYDLDLVDNLFLADSTVTYLSSEREGLIRGIDALREHHEGFGFISGGSPPASELWLEDMHATGHDDAVVVTAVWFFGDRAVSRDSIQRGPVTFVYVYRDDRYRIAHVQFGNY